MKKKISDIHIILNYGHSNLTSGKRSPLYSSLSKEDQAYFKKFQEFGKDRYYEWRSNRVIGKQIAETLKERGWNVHEIYPEEGKDMSLTTIVKKTNEICKKYGTGNCVFLSVHSDAAGNGGWYKARGWAAWTTKGQTRSDKLATYLYKFADKEFPNNKQKVRKETSDKDPDYESNFTVIKGANCPAVLTENFFYDNVDDLKYIVSEKGQHAIVWVHVMGLEEFIYNEMMN